MFELDFLKICPGFLCIEYVEKNLNLKCDEQ